jgi:hypothetical protein
VLNAEAGLAAVGGSQAAGQTFEDGYSVAGPVVAVDGSGADCELEMAVVVSAGADSGNDKIVGQETVGVEVDDLLLFLH